MNFQHSVNASPHQERAKDIARHVPEVRTLSGRNPWTFAVICLVASVQLAIAYAMRDVAWWLVLLCAYIVGATLNHMLWVCIHECSHRLVFSGVAANRCAAILANFPMVLPSAISFERYHNLHHQHHGIYELDADLPSQWEIRAFGRSPVGKAIWLLIFPIVLALRPFRLTSVPKFERWTILNVVAVLAFDILVVWQFGVLAFLYLAASSAFSVGLHPLGARWIQEHFLVAPDQETYSYYGWLNRLQLNVGYHNEHHDFPSVPWNRLPRIKELAPEHYGNLVSHRSWSSLLLKFIFTPSLSLSSRLVRTNDRESG